MSVAKFLVNGKAYGYKITFPVWEVVRQEVLIGKRNADEDRRTSEA